MPRENQRPLDTHRLLTAVCEADVAFVIVGGMAAVAQGSAYITADLDICYQRTPINFQRVSKALRPLHTRLRGAPPGLPFPLDESSIKAGLNFTLITDGGDVDLLGEISGLGFYETVKEQAEEMEVFGYRLWVLTIQGLIRSKEAAGLTISHCASVVNCLVKTRDQKERMTTSVNSRMKTPHRVVLPDIANRPYQKRLCPKSRG